MYVSCFKTLSVQEIDSYSNLEPAKKVKWALWNFLSANCGRTRFCVGLCLMNTLGIRMKLDIYFWFHKDQSPESGFSFKCQSKRWGGWDWLLAQ